MTSHQGQSPPPIPLTPLREAAIAVLQRLVESGHVAYFAGGCVRDRLLGIEPADYDIATSAKPEKVQQLFPKMQTVGEAFGVMLVRKNTHTIQVATFRTDGEYTDHRHPSAVTFTDARHDALRRDFTINGLFEDPLKDEIIDFVNGQDDLKSRLVRAIGDPYARLAEDHLRMLRAVRFASRFGFAIEEETATAITASSGNLEGISRERIGQEIKRMLVDPNRHVAAWELQYLGLDAVILNEPKSLNAPRILGRLPDDSAYSTTLAAWLLDRHAGGLENTAEYVDRWAQSLMLSNDEHRGFRETLSIYAVLVSSWSSLGVARQKRLAASPLFFEALSLLKAIDLQAFVDCRRHVQFLAQTGLAPAPLITGNDLIAHGMVPGPVFKTVLEAVYDAQLEGAITTFDDALLLARGLAAQDTGPERNPPA
ncbi:MAG TPA: CCA tRNA nucleotidyltransferase [Phycisphaerales bacterium]|nr:CCA tRNA nucleotidyltransferase [Phycisphaerales bacterium]